MNFENFLTQFVTMQVFTPLKKSLLAKVHCNKTLQQMRGKFEEGSPIKLLPIWMLNCKAPVISTDFFSLFSQLFMLSKW
jgi:hypothetical protein